MRRIFPWVVSTLKGDVCVAQLNPRHSSPLLLLLYKLKQLGTVYPRNYLLYKSYFQE